MAKVSKKLREQKYVGNTTTKRMTIKGDPFEQVSWKVVSTYDEKAPNEVVLYRLDQEIGTIPNVQYGDVMDLIYDKKRDEFKARKVQLPNEDTELILWLFDLPKAYRAKTPEQYRKIRDERLEAMVKGRKEALHWQKEFTIAGGRIMFAQATPDSDPVCLVGKIIPEFVQETIREILENRELRGLLAYEDISVRLIVQDRFGLTQDDFNELRF